jgi:hypothetical protein
MLFRWKNIDHSLARLRLLELSIEMNQLIEADERRIHFEQRGNMNRNTVPSLLLKMQQDRANELAQRTYDIYCDVWQKQGNEKSADFLRAVFASGIRVALRARAGSIASEFTMVAVRTAFPTALTQAHLRGLDLNMQRMEDRWRRRIEIEAKECEHIDRIAKSRLATRAKETGDLGNLSDEDVGKKRAADIVRAQLEIAEVRGQMDSDDDYDRLKAKYPTFMLFKICEREPELKLLLFGIKGHYQRRALRFAKQVAASHNGIKLNTIEKAWDKYNPDKKTRPPARRSRLKA